MDLMKSWVDTLLIHDNVWLVLTFHGIDGVGWEAKPHGEHKEYFTYMKKREDKLWVATFRDVTKYIRERIHADVKVKKQTDKLVVTLTHSLDHNLYNFPLTLKTYVDNQWKEVKVGQGNKVISIKSHTDSKGTYVLYQALPNAGPVYVTR